MGRKTLDSSTFWEKIYNLYPKVYRDEDANVKYALKRYLQALNSGGFAPVVEKTNELLTLYDPDKVNFAYTKELAASFGFDLFYGIPEDYARKVLPLFGTLYKRKGAIEDIEYLISVFSGFKSEVHTSGKFSEDSVFGECILGEFTLNGTNEYDYRVWISITLPSEVGESKFPDHEQLRRIIKEFMPFYVDAIVAYHFIYTDIVRKFRNIDSVNDITYTRYLIENAKLSEGIDIYNKDTATLGAQYELADMDVYIAPCIFGLGLFGDSIFGDIPYSVDIVSNSVELQTNDIPYITCTEEWEDEIIAV